MTEKIDTTAAIDAMCLVFRCLRVTTTTDECVSSGVTQGTPFIITGTANGNRSTTTVLFSH